MADLTILHEILKNPDIKNELGLIKVSVYLHSLSNFDTWILILDINFLQISYLLFKQPLLIKV